MELQNPTVGQMQKIESLRVKLQFVLDSYAEVLLNAAYATDEERIEALLVHLAVALHAALGKAE